MYSYLFIFIFICFIFDYVHVYILILNLNWIPFSHELKPTKTHPRRQCLQILCLTGLNVISKQMPLKINYKKHKKQNLIGSVSTEIMLTQPFT